MPSTRKSSSPVPRGKGPAVTRRWFVRAGAVAGAAAIMGAWGLRAKSVKAAERKKRDREFGAKLRGAKIKNPLQWARLSDIYRLDPLVNRNQREVVDCINRISEVTGVSPLRIMLTLEKNQISEEKIRAYEIAIEAERKRLSSPENQVRLENIRDIISEVLKAPVYTRKEIAQLLKSRGSLAKLKTALRELEPTEREP